MKCRYCKKEIPKRCIVSLIDTDIKRNRWMELHIKCNHREKIHELATMEKSWDYAIIQS